MTAHEERSRSTITYFRALGLAAVLTAGACTDIGQGPSGPSSLNGNATGDGDGDNNTGKPPTSNPGDGDGDGDTSNKPPSACDQATTTALSALNTYCADCHGPNGNGSGGFRTVLDVNAMINEGKVVPNNAAGSPLYQRVSTSSMPPQAVAKRPSQSDIDAIKDWINCGAKASVGGSDGPALKFVDINTRLRAIRDDLYTFENPVDRQDLRYIDLSNYANAGHTNDEIEVYRQAVSFALNSLSQGRQVAQPTPIDAQKLIYRIDITDYNWDAAKWNLLEQIYPYAVVYDEDSRIFPFDETTAQQIRDETKTQIAYIQADWFLSHACRPPLYFQLLDLAADFQGLEAQLGINVQADIDSEQVQRMGTANAGPSQNNRVIERHELNGNQGAFWLSYDFKDNLGTSNIFSHPLDFQQAGGEVIFNLPNGMQAYYVINNIGTRFDKAPNNVVQDPLARDGAVETGESCMNCHMEDGMLPKYDEVRDFFMANNNNAADLEKVLALYVDKATAQSVFEQDSNLYKTAKAAAGVTKLGATTMHSLDNVFLDIMHLNDVASVMGISTEDFERALDASPGAFPTDIVTLREQNGAINRDSFEGVIDGIITGLGLGSKLQINAAAGAAAAP